MIQRNAALLALTLLAPLPLLAQSLHQRGVNAHGKLAAEAAIPPQHAATLSGSNMPPVAPDQSFAAHADPVSFDLLAAVTDADGDPVSFVSLSAESPAGCGTASWNAQTSHMDFLAENVGDCTFTYTVSDGLAQATGQLTVTASPIIYERSARVTWRDYTAGYSHSIWDWPADQGGSLRDGNGQPLTYRELASPIVPAGAGSFAFIPPETFKITGPGKALVGQDVLLALGLDSTTSSPTSSLNIKPQLKVTFSIINTRPVAPDLRFVLEFGEPAKIDLLSQVFDADGDPIAFSEISADTGCGSANWDASLAKLRYTPRQMGECVYTYTVTDSVQYASGKLTVFAANLPPVTVNHQFEANEDPVSFDVLAGVIDPDGDPVTLIGLSAESPAGCGVGSLNLPRNMDFVAKQVGQCGFTYTVSDGFSQNDGRITVTSLPTVDQRSVDIPWRQALSGAEISIWDWPAGEGGPIVDGAGRASWYHDVQRPPQFATVVAGDPEVLDEDIGAQPYRVIYTSPNAQPSIDDFRLDIDDARNRFLKPQLEVNVYVYNTPPAAIDLRAGADIGTTQFDLLAAVSDAEGDPLDFVSISPAAACGEAAWNAQTRRLEFTQWEESDCTFTFVVTDTRAQSTGTITFFPMIFADGFE